MPLIITYVRHAMSGCYKENATGIERLCCDNEWLIGDACLSSGYWSCEDSDLCLFQDIETLIDWFSAVMWGAIRMCNSLIGGANESSCLAKSVDQEVCPLGTFIGIL